MFRAGGYTKDGNSGFGTGSVYGLDRDGAMIGLDWIWTVFA